MYKNVSANSQRRSSFIPLRDLAKGGVELTSDEEKLVSVKAAIKALHAQFLAGEIPPDARKEAVERQRAMEAESSALRKKISGDRAAQPPDLSEAFFQVVKRELPSWQYKRLIEMAKKLSEGTE